MWIYPYDHKKAICKACRAPIIWVVTERLARAPMDEVIILEHAERMIGARQIPMICIDQTKNHFATCPFATRFKKPRTKADPPSPDVASGANEGER